MVRLDELHRNDEIAFVVVVQSAQRMDVADQDLRVYLKRPLRIGRADKHEHAADPERAEQCLHCFRHAAEIQRHCDRFACFEIGDGIFQRFSRRRQIHCVVDAKLPRRREPRVVDIHRRYALCARAVAHRARDNTEHAGPGDQHMPVAHLPRQPQRSGHGGNGAIDQRDHRERNRRVDANDGRMFPQYTIFAQPAVQVARGRDALVAVFEQILALLWNAPAREAGARVRRVDRPRHPVAGAERCAATVHGGRIRTQFLDRADDLMTEDRRGLLDAFPRVGIQVAATERRILVAHKELAGPERGHRHRLVGKRQVFRVEDGDAARLHRAQLNSVSINSGNSATLGITCVWRYFPHAATGREPVKTPITPRQPALVPSSMSAGVSPTLMTSATL